MKALSVLYFTTHLFSFKVLVLLLTKATTLVKLRTRNFKTQPMFDLTGSIWVTTESDTETRQDKIMEYLLFSHIKTRRKLMRRNRNISNYILDRLHQLVIQYTQINMQYLTSIYSLSLHVPVMNLTLHDRFFKVLQAFLCIRSFFFHKIIQQLYIYNYERKTVQPVMFCVIARESKRN